MKVIPRARSFVAVPSQLQRAGQIVDHAGNEAATFNALHHGAQITARNVLRIILGRLLVVAHAAPA
jgi:nitric oxide synthase oxygenase domain/subunit